MKVVAAYLLAVLGGNASPSADDLKNILASGTLFLFQIRITMHCFYLSCLLGSSKIVFLV